MVAKIVEVLAILRERLIKHEGLRLKPYLDSRGLFTIGVGRCLDRKGISEDEAYYLLQNDMVECVRLVKEKLPWAWGLDNERFSVLAEMGFQLGIDGLLLFKEFIAYLEVGDYDKAAAEMLNSKWAQEDSPRRALALFEIMRLKDTEKGGGEYV